MYVAAGSGDPSLTELVATSSVEKKIAATSSNLSDQQRKIQLLKTPFKTSDWILNPLSRGKRKNSFSAAAKDESEAQMTSATPGVLGMGVWETQQPQDAVDGEVNPNLTVKEERMYDFSTVQSPLSRNWSLAGGRRAAQGIKRSTSVAVLEDTSEQHVKESLAI